MPDPGPGPARHQKAADHQDRGHRPNIRAGRVEADAKCLDVRIVPGVDGVVDCDFDREDEARDHRQRRHEGDQVAGQDLAQGPSLQKRAMHHQKAGDATRREHHHRDEDQSEIELPHRRQIAEAERKKGDKDGADDRPDKEADAADIGGEQHRSRLHGAKIGRIGDLEVDGRERSGDAGKESRKAEREIAHNVRIVTDELHPLGIVAHRIAHPAQWRAGEGVHGDDGNQRPRRHQIVDLDLRPKTPVEYAQQLGAVGRDAGLAAEKCTQDQCRGGDQFGDAERNHRERGSAALGRDPTEQHREQQSGQSTDQRHHGQRYRQLVDADHVDGVNHQETAEAVIYRVAERQHAGLAQQDVVGQREDNRDTDQAERGQRSAGAE